MLERIRLSRAKGWRLPEGAINCARPGKLGNLFVVGKFGNRAECVSAFAVLAAGYIDLGTPHVEVDEQLALHARIRGSVRTCAGKKPACWCDHKGPCHGDVLAHLWSGGSVDDLTRFYVAPPRGRIMMLAKDIVASKRKRANTDQVPA